MPTADTLRNSLDAELERIYSETVDWANDQKYVVDSVNSAIAKATFVREELYRRAIERSSSRVERLTWVITALTVVNVLLVAVSVL